MNREPVIKAVNEILRKGYFPREKEKYGAFCFYANCLAHACFNFKNSQLETLDKRLPELGMDEFDYIFKNPFGEFSENSLTEAKSEIFDFLHRTGLQVEVETTQKELKQNQYRVAMYFSEAYTTRNGEKDMHFVLQERDGSWSSKEGSGEVEFLPNLENTLPFRNNNRYRLHNILTITNPYGKNEESSKQIITPVTESKNSLEFYR